MSLWGVHVGFAAIVTTLVVARLRLPAPYRWVVVAASGAWAVVPDFYWFVPGIRPWYKPLVHDSAVANLFWFHGVIDRADPRDRPIYSVGMALLFVLVFLGTEARLRRRSARRPRP